MRKFHVEPTMCSLQNEKEKEIETQNNKLHKTTTDELIYQSNASEAITDFQLINKRNSSKI